jgi:hypothetical protein
MKSNLLVYYKEEMADWRKTLAFSLGEINRLDSDLHEILSRDSIPGLAYKAERLMERLATSQNELLILLEQLKVQEQEYNKVLGVESLVDMTGLKERQRKIRNRMRLLEQNFINIKYDSQDFISERQIPAKEI